MDQQQRESNTVMPDPVWGGESPRVYRAEPIKAKMNSRGIKNRYDVPDRNEGQVTTQVEEGEFIPNSEENTKVVKVGSKVTRRVEIVERIERVERVVYPVTQKSQKQ